MHLHKQRDDNVINLRQYILQYNVANQTSLRNVAFHLLTSGMQLAIGFMQLTVARRIGATKYDCAVFLKEIVNSALEWE